MKLMPAQRCRCRACVRANMNSLLWEKLCCYMLDRNRSYFMVHSIAYVCRAVCECVCEVSREKVLFWSFCYAGCPMQACECLPPRVLVSTQEQTSSRASWCIKIQFVFFLRVVVGVSFLLFFLVHDFCAHWIYCMCALLLQATSFNINNL